jgi:chromosome segregation ATPase
MTTVLSDLAPVDGFTPVVTLLGALADPKQVLEAIEKIRAENAERTKLRDETQALIDKLEADSASLKERENKLADRERHVDGLERDVMHQSEKNRQEKLALDAAKTAFDITVAEQETMHRNRMLRIAEREETLQRDTANTTAILAGRETKLAEAEAKAAAAIKEADELRLTWLNKTEQMRKQLASLSEGV